MRNIRLNLVENVEVVIAAASSKDGTAPFWYLPSESAPSSSGLDWEFFEPSEPAQFSAPTIRLDTLLADRRLLATKQSLIKVDVESHEPHVLEGMGRFLASEPTIFVEILPGTGTAQAIHDLVDARSYQYFELRPDGPAVVERLGENARIRNYLITPFEATEVARYWREATETSALIELANP